MVWRVHWRIIESDEDEDDGQMTLVRFIWIQYTLRVPLIQPNSLIVLRNQVGWWVIGCVLVDCDFTWFKRVTLCAKYKKCLFKVFHLFTWCSREWKGVSPGGRWQTKVCGRWLINHCTRCKRYGPHKVSVPLSPGIPNSNGSVVAPRDNVLAIRSVVYDENNRVCWGTLQAFSNIHLVSRYRRERHTHIYIFRSYGSILRDKDTTWRNYDKTGRYLQYAFKYGF